MLLLDLDNTLIRSIQADKYSLEKIQKIHKSFQFNSENEFINLYQESRKEIKETLVNKPENRLRLLYFKKVCEKKFNQLDCRWIQKINNYYLDYFKDFLEKDKKNYQLEYNKTFDLLEKIQNRTNIFFITNGVLDIQILKLKTILPKNIKYKLICSQEVGYEKPSKEIFLIALKESNNEEKNIMIGDSYQDDILSSVHLNLKSIYVKGIFSKNTNIHKKYIDKKEYIEVENLNTALEYSLKEIDKL